MWGESLQFTNDSEDAVRGQLLLSRDLISNALGGHESAHE